MKLKLYKRIIILWKCNFIYRKITYILYLNKKLDLNQQIRSLVNLKKLPLFNEQ